MNLRNNLFVLGLFSLWHFRGIFKGGILDQLPFHNNLFFSYWCAGWLILLSSSYLLLRKAGFLPTVPVETTGVSEIKNKNAFILMSVFFLLLLFYAITLTTVTVSLLHDHYHEGEFLGYLPRLLHYSNRLDSVAPIHGWGVDVFASWLGHHYFGSEFVNFGLRTFQMLFAFLARVGSVAIIFQIFLFKKTSMWSALMFLLLSIGLYSGDAFVVDLSVPGLNRQMGMVIFVNTVLFALRFGAWSWLPVGVLCIFAPIYSITYGGTAIAAVLCFLFSVALMQYKKDPRETRRTLLCFFAGLVAGFFVAVIHWSFTEIVFAYKTIFNLALNGKGLQSSHQLPVFNYVFISGIQIFALLFLTLKASISFNKNKLDSVILFLFILSILNLDYGMHDFGHFIGASHPSLWLFAALLVRVWGEARYMRVLVAVCLFSLLINHSHLSGSLTEKWRYLPTKTYIHLRDLYRLFKSPNLPKDIDFYDDEYKAMYKSLKPYTEKASCLAVGNAEMTAYNLYSLPACSPYHVEYMAGTLGGGNFLFVQGIEKAKFPVILVSSKEEKDRFLSQGLGLAELQCAGKNCILGKPEMLTASH